MTFYVEYDDGIEADFSFEADTLARQVGELVLAAECCPYDVCVNVLLTDDAGIRSFNQEFRQIDRATDVLSFPNLEFEREGVFAIPEGKEADYFDPETGELVLGDIILSLERMTEQAKTFGHSQKREFAFLVAHSMLHLCGYDHMGDGEAKVMEAKQEEILNRLGITRDGK